MTEQQPIGTCAILINDQRQIVLGKRKNAYKAGLYGLPGGRAAVGESLEIAIAREVLEETGMVNLNFQYVGVVRENQGGYDFVHFVFMARVGEQQPQLIEPDKCEGWDWCALEDMQEGVLPGHSAAIELFLNGEGLTDLTDS